MYLIGLTGGIASGKSVVGARLAQLGAVHIDADQLARQVVEPGSATLARVVSAFGPQILGADGTLDRAALGGIVFQDIDKRGELNAIIHPAVRQRTKQMIKEAEARNPDAVVVYDVPLLVEAAGDDLAFDLVVVVHADAETRIRRMVELRGLSRDEALHRLNSQATDTERLAVADVVIDSGGTIEQTLAQADELWARVGARQDR